MPLPASAQRLVLAALSVRFRFSQEPVYAEMAWITALAGVLGNPPMRHISAMAVAALGAEPTRAAAWRFAWRWWYERATGEVLAYQADRLTPQWALQHVEAPAGLPPGGAILVSVHHFYELQAFARLSAAVDELGATSLFEPVVDNDPELLSVSPMLNETERLRALSRFTRRVFGPRVYRPSVAARRGLELLRRGGYLVVLADFFGKEQACILGRQIPVAQGPIWWAEQSGRPIVPFLAAPPVRPGALWQLWCGEPIAASRPAITGAVEDCIRRLPTAWMSWRGWSECPACESTVGL
jgi:hypothetical protein